MLHIWKVQVYIFFGEILVQKERYSETTQFYVGKFKFDLEDNVNPKNRRSQDWWGLEIPKNNLQKNTFLHIQTAHSANG